MVTRKSKFGHQIETQISLILLQVYCKGMHCISPISVHNLLRQRTSNVNRSKKKKKKKKKHSFTEKLARSRRYPKETSTDAIYADDIVLLANTPTEAEYLVYILGRAAGGIGLHVNADKTEYMCFNRRDISTQNGSSLKLVNRFKYLGSSVLSTESDINMSVANACTTIDRLLIIWKSDPSDRIMYIYIYMCVCVEEILRDGQMKRKLIQKHLIRIK